MKIIFTKKQFFSSSTRFSYINCWEYSFFRNFSFKNCLLFPVPLNSSKITSSILLPVSIKAVDIIVKDLLFYIFSSSKKSFWPLKGICIHSSSQYFTRTWYYSIICPLAWLLSLIKLPHLFCVQLIFLLFLSPSQLQLRVFVLVHQM